VKAGLVLAVAMLLLAAGCGGDDGTTAETASPPETQAAPPAAEPVEVKLEPVGDAGQSGTVTLMPSDRTNVDVVMEISEPKTGQQAHIHDVTCAQYAAIDDFDKQLATVRESLKEVEGPRTASTMAIFDQDGLAARTTGEFSINVHKVAYPYEATACGDIPKR
jgi:hypothetical protein